MWNGIEGIPGSGKSYEAVAYHILPALKAGRKVVTNLPLKLGQIGDINPDYLKLIEIRRFPRPIKGIWDADAASRGEMAFRPFEDGREENPPDVPVFGHVWDFFDEWRKPDGLGPLYVVDECHNAWAKSGPFLSKELKEVIQWAKLSRHYGADVTGITQSWRDVHPSLSTLLASLVKLRKADILGKDGYIRKVFGGFRGAVISTEQREYKPEYFAFYRSHTQGPKVAEASMSDVSPMVAKFKKATYAVLAVGVVLTVYSFWPKNGKIGPFQIGKPKAQAVIPVSIQRPGDAPIPNLPASVPQAVTVAKVTTEVPEEKPEEEAFEPLRGQTIHITGHIENARKKLILFAVSKGDRVFYNVTSDDLKAAGYKVEHLAPCFGSIEYPGAKKRPVTCDPPINSGQQDRPIVMDSSTGEYSDRRNRRYEDAPGQTISQREPGPQYITIGEHKEVPLKERASRLQ